MADIFLSYAREDQARARMIAAQLESHGWSVWWDRHIPHGKDFNTYIEHQLETARCVVVLWSKASVASKFVRDEAEDGLSRERLVPALVERVKPPLGFRQIHGADLSEWHGESPHDEFDRLLVSIAEIVPTSRPGSSPELVHPVSEAEAPQPVRTAHAQSETKGETDPRRRVGGALHGSTILAIDFGVTHAAVAVIEGGKPVVVTNEGGRRMPSMVAFTRTGDRLVGRPAKRQAITNPENTISSIRRFIGQRYDEVTEQIRMVPYRLIRGGNGDARVVANGNQYSPLEVSAMILQSLKQAAEDYLGRPVAMAVITVPAYFNDAQRQATRDAAQIAGLEVARIVNEPTAAALAYGFDKRNGGTLAVYDFGGGTFDISIVGVRQGLIEVKAVDGDMNLGGDDLDRRVMEWIRSEFQKRDGIDLSNDLMALQRLKEAAETAKIELSTVMETNIVLPFLAADQTGAKHLQMTLTREKFEQLVLDLLQKTAGPTRRALSEAEVDPSKIDDVVLAGGSSCIPKVQEIVSELFGKKPRKSINPDEVVVAGAALCAGVLMPE